MDKISDTASNKVSDIQEEERLKKQIEEKLKHEIEENSTPMWLTNQFIDKPVIILIIFIVFFFACLGISVGADMAKMAESTNRDYLIWSNDRV